MESVILSFIRYSPSRYSLPHTSDLRCPCRSIRVLSRSCPAAACRPFRACSIHTASLAEMGVKINRFIASPATKKIRAGALKGFSRSPQAAVLRSRRKSTKGRERAAKSFSKRLQAAVLRSRRKSTKGRERAASVPVNRLLNSWVGTKTLWCSGYILFL